MANGCARSTGCRRSHGTLKAIEQRRSPEPGPDVWLVFAPIKRARLDWLVEKATELGAAALVPVLTARTQSERLNRERLRVIAIAAAEQSERLSLPEIRAEAPLDRLLADWPADRRLILCDESGAGQPIAEALAGSRRENAGRACLSARKAGFAETELDALGKLSIVTRVGLGPRVLRAETAALAALAVFQAIAGDWRRRPWALSAGSFSSSGVSGAACLGRRACKDRRSPTSGSWSSIHESGSKPPERVADRHRAREIRLPPRRSDAGAV